MRCSGIDISGDGIGLTEGDPAAVAVPKEEILLIRLCHDSRSKRPFLRFFSGFMLILTGLIFLIAAFFIAEGGVFLLHLNSLKFGVPLVPIVLWAAVGAGLWLVLGVFPGRYNLLITTKRGTTKLFFGESAGIGEIRDFLAQAERRFGYRIDTDILETMHFGKAEPRTADHTSHENRT